MLDDTCYMLGFNDLEFAAYTWVLLNTATAKDFLQSITFPDAKRTFTKEVLMRIDLLALAKQLHSNELQLELEKLNNSQHLPVTAVTAGRHIFNGWPPVR